MAIEVEDLQRAQEEIEDYMDDMSDDLCDVEDEVFGNEDENDEDGESGFDVHVECPSLQ
jgi:hypothetical protein